MTDRPGREELDILAGLGTATIGEVAGKIARGVGKSSGCGIRALDPRAPGTAGVALTVRCRPGDNLALHLALKKAGAGDMLVVDYGGDTTTGPFGEIMALAAQQAGLRGLVIDSCVRDSAQIAAMGFATFCRGTAVPGTTKADRGEIGTGCTIDGTAIGPGDLIVADADVILVLEPGDLPRIIADGQARLAKEAEVMDRLRRGETTCEIFGLH